MAYFDGCSKKTASKHFAHEIHSWYACEHRLNQLTAVSNKPLLATLQATGNPERKLSTAELNQMKRRTSAPAPFAIFRTIGIVRGSAHKSTGLVHIPKTKPNHLLLPRRALKAHHQRVPNPLPLTQPRARPPDSPLIIILLFPI